MRSCAILHPLHLELETAQLNLFHEPRDASEYNRELLRCSLVIEKEMQG